ncbi:hypothetical protein ACWIGM_18865 [Bosea sp. NPDC055332]
MRLQDAIVLLGLCPLIAGCVSNAPPPRLAAVPTDPALKATWGEIADRTFLAASEGNLRGSIYFASNGSAVQAAQDRGIRRLAWSVEKTVDGLKGPAVCVSGGYHDVSGAAVDLQRNGQAMSCAPVSSFRQIRSSRGNSLGLGTIIQ